MKKFKGTQGEWKIRFENFEGKDNGECGFFIEAQEPKNHIGKIEIMMEDYGEQSGYPREQRLEDAKLIAAAPELLECLTTIIKSMGHYEDLHVSDQKKYIRAIKAISKATDKH